MENDIRWHVGRFLRLMPETDWRLHRERMEQVHTQPGLDVGIVRGVLYSALPATLLAAWREVGVTDDEMETVVRTRLSL